jgi:hypothetical protein
MQTRKSSISLEPAQQGCFFHMMREVVPSYIVDSVERNSYDKSAAEAMAYYEKLLNEANVNYMTRTKQMIQVANEKLIWEAVVVLDAHHTLNDVKKLTRYLENKYEWQVICAAVHNDEGYKDKITNKITYNYHAHILFLMLNKWGIYVFKKRDFGKKAMSVLQTEVATILQMPRGESKLKSRRERLSAKQYRKVAQEKYDLKFEIKRISAEADTFEDAMLCEHKLRIEREDEIKKLQEKIKILEKKNIITSSDDVHDDQDTLSEQTIKINSVLK